MGASIHPTPTGGSESFEVYADFSAFPVTGEVDKLYYDSANTDLYGWDGAVYEQLNGGGGPGDTPEVEHLTLSGGDITNQYKDLAQTIVPDTLLVSVYGVVQYEGEGYTLSTVSGKTRITFIGDLATGGASALVTSDKIHAIYRY